MSLLLKRKSQRPSAQELFTDREEERQVIARFLDGLVSPQGRTQQPVLNFYGLGGIGKSTLLAKAVSEAQVVKREQLRLITLNVDTDTFSIAMAPTELLWQLRCELNRQRISTPLFDYLFLIYRATTRPGEAVNVGKSLIAELINGVGSVSESGGNVAGVFEHLQEMSNYAQAGSAMMPLANMAASWLRKKFTERKLDAEGLNGIESMTVAQLEGLAPDLMASDLIDNLSTNKKRALFIAIDGFERIQSEVPKKDAQYAIACFCKAVTDARNWEDAKDHGHIGFLVLGRASLHWHELYPDLWKAEEFELHLLGGLSELDARDFLLNKSVRALQAKGLDAAANLLEQHVGAILTASAERSDARGVFFYYPYFLDLAVGMVLDKGADFKAEMLGRNPLEMQQRFLKYLQPEKLRALQTLALALQFDEALFRHLVTGSFLGKQYAVQDFGRVADANEPYIVQLNDGQWTFHRHMSSALLQSLMQTAADRHAAQVTIDGLGGYFLDKIPEEASQTGTAQHLEARRSIEEIVLTHTESGLASLDTCVKWLGAVYGRFEVDQVDAVSQMVNAERFLSWLLARQALKPLSSETPAVRLSVDSVLTQTMTSLSEAILILGETSAKQRLDQLINALLDGSILDVTSWARPSMLLLKVECLVLSGQTQAAEPCLVAVRAFINSVNLGESGTEAWALNAVTFIRGSMFAGSLYLAQNQPEAALQSLQSVWDLRDQLPMGVFRASIGDLMIKARQQLNQDFSDIKAELEGNQLPLGDLESSWMDHLTVLSSFYDLGNWQEVIETAVPLIKFLVQKHPDSSKYLIVARRLLGSALSKTGRNFEALGLLQGALRGAQESGTSATLQADIAFKLASALIGCAPPVDYDQAAELLQFCITTFDTAGEGFEYSAAASRLELSRVWAALDGRSAEAFQLALDAAAGYSKNPDLHRASELYSLLQAAEIVVSGFEIDSERRGHLISQLQMHGKLWNEGSLALPPTRVPELYITLGCLLGVADIGLSFAYFMEALVACQPAQVGDEMHLWRVGSLRKIGNLFVSSDMPREAHQMFDFALQQLAGLPDDHPETARYRALVGADVASVRKAAQEAEALFDPWRWATYHILAMRTLASLGSALDPVLLNGMDAVKRIADDAQRWEVAVALAVALLENQGYNEDFLEQTTYQQLADLLEQLAQEATEQEATQHGLAARLQSSLGQWIMQNVQCEQARPWLERADLYLSAQAVAVDASPQTLTHAVNNWLALGACLAGLGQADAARQKLLTAINFASAHEAPWTATAFEMARLRRKGQALMAQLPLLGIPFIVTDDSGVVTGRSGDRDRRHGPVKHSAL